jgi:hypothetical protein
VLERNFSDPLVCLLMVLRILWLVDHLIYMHAACGWWVSKQDENSVQVEVQMPGLSAEHVKVRTDPKGLFIKGEGVKDPDDVQEPARYSCRIDFSADSFRVNPKPHQGGGRQGWGAQGHRAQG